MDTRFNYRYLNLENSWPYFSLTGLIIREDGALSLARVPQAETTLATLPPAVTALGGPAGIGVDAGGNLYLADPANHRILRWDACGAAGQALPCFGGAGSLPGQLNQPRGLLVGPRQALYIADSGNHRIQVVDLATLQLRAIWGQPDPWADPVPGEAPGRFNEPWDLAADAAGYLYVVDHGNRRVQKFDADGQVMPAFWETMQVHFAALDDPAPTYAVVAIMEEVEKLLLIDEAHTRLLVFDLDGSLDEAATALWAVLPLNQPAGLVFGDNTLYVGEAGSGRILAFNREGGLIGPVRGYEGTVAGLSLDRKGRLIVHPGSGGGVTRLLPEAAYVEEAEFLAGPFTVGDRPSRWHRLQFEAEALPPGSHARLFTYTSQMDSPPPLPDFAAEPGAAQEVTPLDQWRAAPPDALDLLVLNEPGPYLWLAGTVTGDGAVSPLLHQARLTYDPESWLTHLPAIYQEALTTPFLERALYLFDSLLSDDARRLEQLPGLFDPYAAPDEAPPASWLDWLAGWLALELAEDWDEAQRRQALAEAFARYRQRGTVESLTYLIKRDSGATAHITEPAAFTGLWSLGQTSLLGFDTALVPAQAQGAVVGTTADLDQAHLITAADYGAPLFEDVAHRFCVRVYAADLADPAALGRVQRVLEQEKPAHTCYHLCPIEARLRVGFQAQVGVDTIVSGPPADLVLTEPQQLGLDTVLPASDQTGGHLGQNARLGTKTSLR